MDRATALLKRRAAARERASDPNFAAWYAAYPKHVAPSDALKAWQQTEGDRPPLAEMLATLAWQVRSDFGKRPYDKIPYPARYLRAGQYRDQPPPARPANGAPAPSGLCAFHEHASNANKPARAHDLACSECRHVAALNRSRNGASEPAAVGDLFGGSK